MTGERDQHLQTEAKQDRRGFLMDVAIYGAGTFGRYVYENICRNEKVTAVAWIDNGKDSGSFLGLPVWNETFFLEKCSGIDMVAVAIQDVSEAQSVAISLFGRGYRGRVYLVPKECFRARLPLFQDSGEWSSIIRQWNDILPVLPYLEYQVADHCNLCCKGCMHFSNLVTEEKYPETGEFEVELAKLAEKFRTIEKFRLMGGEPLLNPELHEYIRLARTYFPLADIRVVTNGLRVTEIPDELIHSMKMYCAGFDISQYAPTRRRIFQIIDFLEQKQIQYSIGEPIEKFMIRASHGEENPEKVFYDGCLSKQCTFLRGGRLYVCPHIPMLYEQKDFFGIEISEHERDSNSIDLLHGTENGWGILKRLKKPFSLCRFCSSDFREIPWENGVARAEDWFV